MPTLLVWSWMFLTYPSTRLPWKQDIEDVSAAVDQIQPENEENADAIEQLRGRIRKMTRSTTWTIGWSRKSETVLGWLVFFQFISIIYLLRQLSKKTSVAANKETP